MIIIFFIFSLFMLPADEDGIASGVIGGHVVNGTFENEIVAEQTVVLERYVEEVLQDSLSIDTDREGNFSFGNLPVNSDGVYFIITAYEGMQYFSEAIILSEKEPVREVHLAVYETSDDESNIHITNRHIIVGPAEGGLIIQEIILMKNGVPYTFGGEDSRLIKLSLPEGAYNFGLSDHIDENYSSVTDGALFLSIFIPPVDVEVAYWYNLSVASETYSLKFPVDYTTDRANVFISVPGIEVSSNHLNPSEPMETESGTFQRLTGDTIGSGETIELHIEDSSVSVGKVSPVPLFILAAALLLFTLIYPFIREKKG